MKRSVLIAWLVFVCLTVVGQTQNFDFQSELESLLEASLAENENANVEQLLNELQTMREHPININQATRVDLQSLYFLSASQIDNLLNYRQQFGQIYSPFELNSIEGFSPKIIQVLEQFVLFGDVMEVARKQFVNQEVLVRAIRLVELQKGFREPKKYEGSPEKLYARYRLSASKWHAGLTAEKDAGESFFSGSNPNGFDYYSGFFNLNISKHVQLFFGDYVVQFGQGLTAWQGFSLSKSAEVDKVAKFNPGIKSYSSTDENNFLRGGAAQITLGRFRWCAFVSNKNFDANRDSLGGQAIFTSFQTSGLHRTVSEIEDKNSVSAFVSGSNLNYSAGKLSMGISALHYKYGLPLKRNGADYNRFLFEGDELTNLGMDYQLGINRCYFFGEAAWSSTGGLSTLHGLQANPVDPVQLSIVYRNIGKKYNAPVAGAFTEGSRVNDEQGLYLGVAVEPAPKIKLRMYADFFQHRWITYTTAAPSFGQEYLFQADYRLSDNWSMYGRYFYERKPVKASGEFTKINLDQVRQKLRLHLNGGLGEKLFLKSRVEWSWFRHDHYSSGILVFQDVGFDTQKIVSSWWLRLAYFNTDDYDARIYAYENDLLYQFSVPAFYGEGLHFYFNGKVKICENLDAWLKASRSSYIGADRIGSGNSEVEGNKRTEVKFQLRFTF